MGIQYIGEFVSAKAFGCPEVQNEEALQSELASTTKDERHCGVIQSSQITHCSVHRMVLNTEKWLRVWRHNVCIDREDLSEVNSI